MRDIITLSLMIALLSGCVFSKPAASPEEMREFSDFELCYITKYANDDEMKKIKAEFVRRGVKSHWMSYPAFVGPDIRVYCPGIDEE